MMLELSGVEAAYGHAQALHGVDLVVDEGEVTGMLSLRDLFVEIIDEQSETIDQLEDYIRGGH